MLNMWKPVQVTGLLLHNNAIVLIFEPTNQLTNKPVSFAALLPCIYSFYSALVYIASIEKHDQYEKLKK